MNTSADRWLPSPSFTGIPPWLPQRPKQWQNWPGAYLPETAHPPGTTHVGYDRIPQYPGGTTCHMLGERDPYFPMDWSMAILLLTAVLIYIVWPLYVLRHLIRKVHIPDHCMSETHADDRSLSMATMNSSRPSTMRTETRWEPLRTLGARCRRIETRMCSRPARLTLRSKRTDST